MTSQIDFDGVAVARRDGETVLDALLRAGCVVPHSCKAGACQSCLMEQVGGAPQPAAQAGLKPSFVTRNYFLACRSVPDGDIAVRLPGAGQGDVAATLVERRMLSDDVAAIWLKADADPAEFRPGQYVTLLREADGVARSYSIANLPDQDGLLELHVRRIPNGTMSGWLHDAPIGQALRVRGPAGDCFYPAQPAARDFPLLLAGTGTGLAPLMGVLRDALRSGHEGPILMFHGGLSAQAFYLADDLRDLAAARPNLHCRFVALDHANDDDARGDIAAGHIVDHVMAALPGVDPKRTEAYFCGAPDLVAALKKKTFLAGLASRSIHVDPFLPSAA